MLFYIPRTGLEIFDLCRAYGLAALLDRAVPEEERPVIKESGYFYIVETHAADLRPESLEKNAAWPQLFELDTWRQVFLTDKNKWNTKKEKVEKILTEKENLSTIANLFQKTDNLPAFSTNKGETLSGPLDPSAFKGLRGKTRGDYEERQTKVDSLHSLHWALACLGGAIAGRYIVQKAQGNKWDYFVIFPVPQKIEFSNFQAIKETTYTNTKRLNYLSVQNAAAHFAVLLAQKIMELAASKSQYSDRFSGVYYFSLIQTGQQSRPSAGGNLSLYPLMELALSQNPEVAKTFEVWEYLFRKGSVKGCEDLAMTITDFIMHPSLESFERHTRTFLKYILKGEIKGTNNYTEKSLKEVINYVQ